MHLTDRIIDIPLDEDNILLINSISSALDIVDKPTYEKIKNFKNGKPIGDMKLLGQLKQRGYIFENDSDEDKLINKFSKFHEQMSKFNRNLVFTICPTMGCNLRCVYCFEGDDNLSNPKIMTEGQLHTIFDFIDKTIAEQYELVKNMKVNGEDADPSEIFKAQISIFGGEPLLLKNRPLIEDILEFGKERSLGVSIITNGTTIDKYIDLLKQYDNVAVQITLDGSKSIHDTRRVGVNKTGTFDKIIESVDILDNAGINVHLRTNVNEDNIESISELRDFIIEKGWHNSKNIYPYVAPVMDYCDGKNNSMPESVLYREVLKIEPNLGKEEAVIKTVSAPNINFINEFFTDKKSMKPWKLGYCEATSGGNFVFSPNGDITTCLMLAGHCEELIGTYDDDGVYIKEDLNSKWADRTVTRIERCSKCQFGFLCGGGCPVAAIDLNNDIDCPVCSDIKDTLVEFVTYNKDRIINGEM